MNFFAVDTMDHSVSKTCNAVKNNFLNVFSASPRVCQREDVATTAPQPPSERRWTRLKAPEKSFHAARETRR